MWAKTPFQMQQVCHKQNIHTYHLGLNTERQLPFLNRETLRWKSDTFYGAAYPWPPQSSLWFVFHSQFRKIEDMKKSNWTNCDCCSPSQFIVRSKFDCFLHQVLERQYKIHYYYVQSLENVCKKSHFVTQLNEVGRIKPSHKCQL